MNLKSSKKNLGAKKMFYSSLTGKKVTDKKYFRFEIKTMNNYR